MTKEKKEILDELLVKFDYHRTLETEDFLYWIKEYHYYDGQLVSREEFVNVKDYAIKHGELPCMILREKIEEEVNKSILGDKWEPKEEKQYDRNVNTATHSNQMMVRYSKKYDNLEVYEFTVDVRASTRRESDRVLCMRKRKKILSINSKNYVLVGGNRWLSLKNWVGFLHGSPSFITEGVCRKLMNLMIGEKDWILNLEMESIYISNKNSRKANSMDEAIQLECGTKPVKLIKKVLNNDVNDIINLYNLIDHNQIHSLTNFIKRNHLKIKKIFEQDGYGLRSERLLYLYFLVKDNRCSRGIFDDYLRMLKQEGGKVNLNIRSYTTIKRKHDEVSRVILEKNRDKRRLKVAKVYPKVESIPGLKVEMIRSANRLNLESEILHHCVHTYKTSINNGSCAIYSLVHEEERYTLEVKAVKKPKEDEEAEDEYEFKINQLRGKYNCSPPTSMKKHIEKMCENNELTLPENRVTFRDVVKKKDTSTTKKEVIQIGEEVLDRMIQGKGIPANDDLPF